MATAPVSVIELPGYQRDAEDILSADERDDVINTIAFRPLAGDIIPGTGGLRKLRVARQGIGKRGGARVIYYFHNEGFPALLVAIFAKNARADLSSRLKREYSELVKDIVDLWRKQ